MAVQAADRPQWLDDEFLRVCIRNSHHINNTLKVLIKNATLTYLVPKGENFMSVIYRGEISYQVESGPVKKDTLVVKVVHVDEKLAKISTKMFDKEIDMYTNLMPKLEKILECKGLKTQLVCRYLHTIHNPRVIVFEDLKPNGFVVANRQKGMDLEHCKYVYNKIAKLHAAAMCFFHSQRVEANSEYLYSGFQIVSEEDLGMTPMIQSRIDWNNKEMASYKNKYTKAIDFCRKYSELLDKTRLPLTPYVPDNKFNSLNHTDVWVNNMMFKYNPNGSIADLLFVDLQCVHYTSVAFDFLFFFFSSASLEVRRNIYEELKKLYFDTLVSDLKLLDYKGDIPTRQEFQEELKRNTMTVMHCLTLMLPGIVQHIDEETKSREKAEALSFDDIGKLMNKTKGDRNYMDKFLASVDILQDEGFMDKSPELMCEKF